MASPELRKRIIDSRCAYRDKNAGLAPTDEFGICRNLSDVLAKARVVAKGFQDPDLRELQRHAPVCMRSSLHIALQIFASHMHKDWRMISADIATAFLQGGGQRRQRLFLRPPRDPITARAQTFPHQLYEIITNVYGLSDAPASFATKVVAVMKQLSAKQHPLDHMVFTWYGDERTGHIHAIENKSAAAAGWVLLGVALFHVDDMLLIHHPALTSVAKLRESFSWGSWQEASFNNRQTIVFVGKEIVIHDTYVQLLQQKFLRETDCVESSRRGPPEELIPSSELSNYRSVVGSLQWLASSSRPDLAAPTSLLQSGDPQRVQLRGLCSTLQQAKTTED
eukprot:6483629-Amphidinium_carterae.1